MALIAWQMIRHTKQACFSLSLLPTWTYCFVSKASGRNETDPTGLGPVPGSSQCPCHFSGLAVPTFFPTESESLDSLVLRIPQS